jgi:hypothetical protein
VQVAQRQIHKHPKSLMSISAPQFGQSDQEMPTSGRLEEETPEKHLAQEFPGIELSRELSGRVIRGTNELRGRLFNPGPSKRLGGTSEAYELLDSTGVDKFIFKAAFQTALTDRRSLPNEPTEIHEQPREATHRKEIAAYMLDHDSFSGIMPTTEAVVKTALSDRLPTLSDSHIGMVQAFCDHDQSADEDAWGRCNILSLPIKEVHKVGIFDIRLFNQDRFALSPLVFAYSSITVVYDAGTVETY